MLQNGESKNESIACTVAQCKYHDNSDYCTLDQIQVVNNDAASDEDTIEVTDCGSYERK